MRYVSSAAVAALLMLNGSALFGQSTPNLAITNYQFVSQTPLTPTLWLVTYKADVLNTGTAAFANVTATLVPVNNGVFATQPATSTLTFVNVPAGGQVTSTNTFTIRINRSVQSDLTTLSWTFQSTPAGPVANAGPNQTASVGSTVTLDGSKSTNPGGVGTLTYFWTFASTPPASNTTLKNRSGINPFFVVDVPGTYVINLTVSNGAASSSATVTVSTTNTPPVANAGPDQKVTVESTVTLNGSGSTDVDGNSLTYSWTLTMKPAGSNAALVGATTIMPMFVADKLGTYMAQLIVNDGIANSQPSTVTITTQDTAPVANPGAAQQVNLDVLVQLNGSGSTDVDGNPLTYSWVLISKPGGSNATLSNPGIVNPTFTVDAQGQYMVQLTVNDGFLNSTPATVMITTNTVLPPIANAGPAQKVTPGTTVTLSGSGTDPQNLPLTLQWSLTPPANSHAVLSNTTIPNPTFVADLPGIYVAQLIVNNGVLSSQPATVMITTAFPPPVADPVAPQTTGVGATVTLNGSGSTDFDNQPLTYAWSLMSAPQNSTAALTGATTVSPTFVADLPGPYVVQLIVNDGFTNSNPVTVMITATSGGSITLSPDPLTIAKLTSGGTPTNLTATLPAPAGQNGETLILSSDNTSIASVPATASVSAGSTGVNIPVTPTGTGTAHITVSGVGFGAATSTVNVTPATISVGIVANIGLTNTVNGTVTISAPAGSGGVTIALSSSPTGIVDVEPPTVTIPSGNTTGNFTAQGLATGPTQITAAATGYATGTANVTVSSLGAIVLPATLSVGTGQSVPLQLSLATPAPSGGVTVSLSSTDTSKVTISPASVVITSGQLAPAVQPQVTAVNFGSASINASAPGFTGASTVVQVLNSLSFPQNTLTLIAGATQNLALTLSSPAPSGGLSVNLNSSNTGAATVPTTVSFSTGATSVNVPITGVTAGSATVTATSASGTTTANITVVFGSITLPSGVTLGANMSASFPVTLSNPAPAGGVQVVLSSSDVTKVTISPSTVSIAPGQTTPTTQPTVTGVNFGSANIGATAAGWLPASQAVQVGATLAFNPLSQSIRQGTTQNITLTLSSPAPAGGITVNLSSDTTSVATVPATAAFAANTTTISVPVTAVTVGSATIHASGLPALADTAAAITVTPIPDIILPVAATVGPGQSITYNVTLANPAPPAGVLITLTSADPTIATLRSDTVSIPGGATAPTRQATLNGIGFGSTKITASAAGYTGDTESVQVTTSLAYLPTSVVVSPNGTQSIALLLGTALPNNLTVNLSSDNPAVASVPATVTFLANETSVGVTVTGVSAGTTTIHASWLPNIPDTTASVTVAVPGAVNLPSNVTVAPNQSAAFPVILGTAAPSGGVTVNLSSSSPSTLTVSPASVTIAAGQTTPSPQPQVTGVNYGSATITGSATGYASGTQTVKVAGAMAFTPNTATITTAAPQNLTLTLSSPAPAAGLTINLNSSNTGSATVPATVSFAANATTTTVPVTGVSNGTSIITASSSAPTFLPNATATVTVSAPVTVSTSSLPTGTAGAAYSATLSATGGTGPYIWTASGLPSGLTVTGNQITGTPAASFSGSVTIKVTDSSTPTAGTAQAVVALNINPQLAITTTSLPGGGIGALYSAPLAATGGQGPYTFSATGLPNGLTVSGSQITGTPTSTFSANVTVKVTDSSTPANTAQVSLALSISANLTVTNSSLPAGTQGVGYSVTLTNSGGQSPFVWTATGLPNGLTITGNQITGTPTATFSGNVTIKVSDSSTPTPMNAQGTLALTINAPLAITTSSLPSGNTGVAYAVTLTNTGGQTPFVWSATGLPSGLTITGHQITGTVTATFSGNVTIKVTDSTTPVNTAQVSLALAINAPLAITTSSLPTGTQGTAYTATLANSGGQTPFVWTATGLPGGLTVSGNQITGTPNATFSGNVTIKVTDSATPANSTQVSLALIINAPLAITTSSLPNGVPGSAYLTTLVASGGQTPYAWSATGLPSGLTVSGNQITGTSATSFNGNVTIKVTDSSVPANTAQVTLSLTIDNALSVTTTTLTPGTQNAAYSATITAAGGISPYTFSATGLPSGLTVSGTQITGTPGATFNGSVTLKVTDAINNNATKAVTLVINAPLTITTSSLPTGTQGVAYTANLANTGGQTPYVWSATGLPSGLTISGTQITGNPAVSFNGNVTIKVTDSTSPANTAQVSLALVIDAPLGITTSSLPTGTIGSAYAVTLANTGGLSPFVWSATGLPSGLTVSGNQITGTPNATFNGNVTIKVTDSTTPANTAQVSLALVINAQLTITTTTLPVGTQGVAYSTTLANTGGKSPYVWSATGLPGGLTVSGNQITGTPTASFNGNVTIKVTDSTTPANTAQVSLALVINAPLAITTSSLPTGTQGVAYSVTLANSGGQSPFVWSATGLPAGLTVSGAQITGTPQSSFSGNVTIKVTDSTTPANTAQVSLAVVIDAPLAITTSSLPVGTQGVAYSVTLANTGGQSPYVWSATGLPGGLTVSGNQITGTPTASFSGNVTIKVTDSTTPANTAQVSLALTIDPPLVITTSTLPSGTQSVAYSVTLANTGGKSPYVWSATGLPGGLTVSGNQITGTPTASFSGNVTIKVTDSTTPANTTQASLALTINPPLNITTASLPSGATGVAYTVTLAATGGQTPYVWTTTGLPGGLTISGNQITGTPTATFSGNVKLIVTDSSTPANSTNITLPLSITVPGPALTVSNGTVGQSLQVPILVTLAQPLATATIMTVTSSDPTKVIVAFGQGGTGGSPIMFQAAANNTQFQIWIQGVPGATPGQATITASLPGYTSISGTVSVGPSGFEIAGPNGPGNSFSIFAGQNQTLTVTPVQLDSMGNVVATEQLCSTCSATVQIAENDTTITAGSVAPSSITFNGTAGAMTTTFSAANVASQATTTLSATPPTGFGTPNGASSVFATVNPSSLSCTTVSVGNGLENTAFCSLNGAPASQNFQATVTAGANILLATTASGTASSTITITIAAGAIRTGNFFVIGQASSGTSTYTISVPGLGEMATGNVNLFSSAIVLAGPSFVPGSGITTAVGQPPSLVNVIAEMINSDGSFTQLNVAAGSSVSVNVGSSAPTVGNVSPTMVTIAGGSSSNTTSFTPGSCGSGSCSTVLSINTPSGFTANADQSITASVNVANLGVCGTSNTPVTIGNNLEVACTMNLGGQVAGGSGVVVTLTSPSANLLFSNTPSGAGQQTLQVTVSPGASNATFYMQGYASSGTGSYTASSPGFASKTATNITFVQSGIAISGPAGLNSQFWSFPIPTSINTQVSIAFVPIAFDPVNGLTGQMLAPGASGSNSVTINASVSGVGSLTPTSVTINGGDSSDSLNFTSSTAGSAQINFTQPNGFTTPSMFTFVNLSLH